ncbi:MAG: pyridoxamine 5'-phosphate oxidase family protein [Cytophagales bacterium]|nr:pyridoxamine 5'-phosphate oxidase family protein [Armatimonadota bacterium]
MSEPQTQPSREEALAKLRDLIKGIDIAMLTTVDTTDGTLRSRPMSINGEVEFDGDLWFFTRASSHKVDEIERSPQVNASFAQPEKQNYVSMSGNASLITDREKMKQLWKPHLKAWFPEGTDDPDMALLKVSVVKAEYWDSPSGLLVHVYGVVKATLTGQSPSSGEDVKVNLK